jgi:hypothetical protein
VLAVQDSLQPYGVYDMDGSFSNEDWKKIVDDLIEYDNYVTNSIYMAYDYAETIKQQFIECLKKTDTFYICHIDADGQACSIKSYDNNINIYLTLQALQTINLNDLYNDYTNLNLKYQMENIKILNTKHLNSNN